MREFLRRASAGAGKLLEFHGELMSKTDIDNHNRLRILLLDLPWLIGNGILMISHGVAGIFINELSKLGENKK